MGTGTETEDLSAVVERLAGELRAVRDEARRSVWRLRATWVAVVLVGSASALSYVRVAAAAGSSATPRKIICKQLDLVDDKGNTRAQLWLDTEGSGNLSLHDKDGKKRVQLQGNDNGMFVLGPDETSRIQLWSSSNSPGVVTLYDTRQQRRAQFEGGNAGVNLYDNAGKLMLKLIAQENIGQIGTYSANGNARLVAGTGADDKAGFINFYDSEGNAQCVLTGQRACR